MINQNLVDDAVTSALSHDAIHQNPTDPDAFKKANGFQYRLAINMWLRLLDLNVRDEMLFTRSLSQVGLLAMIDMANSYAAAIIDCRDGSNNLFSQLTSIPKDASHKRVTLERLRFLKRFSITASPTLEKSSIVSFLQEEASNKRYIREGFSEDKTSSENYVSSSNNPEDKSTYFSEPYPEYICRELNAIIREYLLYGKRSYFEGLTNSFSSGSTRDAGSALTSKLCALTYVNPDIVYHRYNMPMFTDQSRHDTAMISAVPKSYKTYRIIAMEDACTQYQASPYQQLLHKIVERQNRAEYATRKPLVPIRNAKAMVGYLFKDWRHLQLPMRKFQNSIPLTNQEVNKWSVENSWNGRYYGKATIDLSHASDSITKDFLRRIWPSDIVDVDSLFSEFIEYSINNRRKRPIRRYMQTASTAGHCLTFVVESIVFFSIVRYCYDIYAALTGEDLSDLNGGFHVYGDDIVVHTEIAPLVMEVLERLGFKVNTDKSHWKKEDLYRETCGGEYWRGKDLTTHYWPRAVISNSSRSFRIHEELTDSLTSLCALQRRLYTFSLQHPSMTGITEAYLYLESVILKIQPDMTYTSYCQVEDEWGDLIDVPASDLYGPVCLVKYENLLAESNSEYSNREVHLIPRVIYNQVSERTNPRMGTLMLWHEIDAKYLYDMYRYEDFLEHGPYYASPLDELLNISSIKLATYQAASGTPRIVWTKGLK